MARLDNGGETSPGGSSSGGGGDGRGREVDLAHKGPPRNCGEVCVWEWAQRSGEMRERREKESRRVEECR